MELIKTGEKDDLIRLKSSTGETGWFRFLELALYQGREYAALADENDDVIVMRFFDETPERYVEITDDAEFEAAVQLLDTPEE